MVYNREGYAPWSLTRKAGVQSATVDGDIEVPQYIQPVLDTGFVDEKGDWKGSKSSEEQFHSFGKDDGIPNGGNILAPQASGSIWPLDMTGFKHVQLAIKTTSGGNYAVTAMMGPDSNSYANLSPVDPASTLQGNLGQRDPQDFTDLFHDGTQSLTANVWNIFMISENLHNQKLLQFNIVNNSGSEADIETAFLRLV
jgi:hypothetical protein